METHPKHPSIDLAITGRKCRIHRNDRVVQSLDEGTNLIELGPDTKYNWRGDDHDEPSHSAARSSSLRLDRYDARTLLDEISIHKLCDGHDVNIDAGIDTALSSEYASQPFDENGSKEAVEARNFERYGTLPEYSSCFLNSKSNHGDSRDGEEKSGKNPSEIDDLVDKKQTETSFQEEEKPFQLSGEQLEGLPPDIILPKTMRHNTIIEHTTSRIALNNQLEVFLKVKQANNSDFSFLNPSDELHRYYLCLKVKHSSSIGKNEKENASTKNDSDNRDGNASDNPLSGLLGGYSSSSEESSSPTNNDRNSTTEEPGGKDVATRMNKDEQAQHEDKGDHQQLPMRSDAQDRKRKTDRLERLRFWKESRLKQSDQNNLK